MHIIDPKELRIGNLVKDGAIVYEVFSVERNAVCLVEFPFRPEGGQKIIKKFPSDITAISLKHNWIQNFSLENKIWEFEILGDDERGYHISTEGGEWIFIEFVHQLQNINFALTGEELQLTEIKNIP